MSTATTVENPRLTGGASGAPGETGKVEGIGALITIAPETISSVGDDGWEAIELAVDSGATETVVSEDLISSAELKEGPAARRGVEYDVANGIRIPNLGEKNYWDQRRRDQEAYYGTGL